VRPRIIRKYLGMSAPDRRLLLESAALLAIIRLGLWVLPFQTLRRFLTRIPPVPARRRQANHGSIGKVVAAVNLISRHFPTCTTCLTQALAIQVLLHRRGRPANLRIGVARGPAGQLQAHAWVESEARIIHGGIEGLTRYTPLSSLERKGL
jgi:Transglutaminase-like superfamily